MRLFFAIELPPPLREYLIALQDRLRPLLPRLSWTKGGNLHLTLKFLGEVDEQRVPRIVEAAGTCPMMTPVTLRPAGLSLLPPRRAFRVLAAALAPDEALTSLQACLEARLGQLGFERERRPYHPHITLARARNPVSDAKNAILQDTLTGIPGPEPTIVREFSLIQSALDPEGPRYTTLGRFG